MLVGVSCLYEIAQLVVFFAPPTYLTQMPLSSAVSMEPLFQLAPCAVKIVQEVLLGFFIADHVGGRLHPQERLTRPGKFVHAHHTPHNHFDGINTTGMYALHTIANVEPYPTKKS